MARRQALQAHFAGLAFKITFKKFEKIAILCKRILEVKNTTTTIATTAIAKTTTTSMLVRMRADSCTVA